MQTVKLGNSDVSALCLGILQMGTRVDKTTSYSILDAYFEAGGRFIDTANNYSKWHAGGVGTESETMLGQWMTDRGNRDELFIATKVGFNRDDIGQSLSTKTIADEAEGSLKRLQTDRVDLYYAHADIRKDPLDKTLEAFNKLVVDGRAMALGCSNYLAWRIEQARGLSRNNGWAEYRCVQQRFTYLRPRAGASFAPQVSGNDDLLDYCRENPDFRMLAYSPLLTGAYGNAEKAISPNYLGLDSDARLDTLASVAKAHGATPNQVVYAWLLGGSPSIIPLTAPTSLGQLEENLGALDVKLTEDELESLTSAGNL
jgi:aryl-alcohol dehydrogenase-like predicted oxidoreductase